MSRDPRLLLEDIRDCCQKIIRYVENTRDSDAFLADERTFDAVMRNLEIVGEAAKQIPEQVRRRLDEIEWRKVAGFRDVAIHAYPTIDEEIVWDIVQNKVPELLATVERALNEMDQG